MKKPTTTEAQRRAACEVLGISWKQYMTMRTKALILKSCGTAAVYDYDTQHVALGDGRTTCVSMPRVWSLKQQVATRRTGREWNRLVGRVARSTAGSPLAAELGLSGAVRQLIETRQFEGAQ